MTVGEVTILVRLLREGVSVPRPMTAGAAGVDLAAAEAVSLEPGQVSRVPTGLAVAIPEGYEAQIRPRSGLALHHAVGMLNSPGTIDSDYRGEICVILINHGRDVYRVQRGDRIAQMVVQRVVRPRLVERSELPGTPRGDGGFGHTGR